MNEFVDMHVHSKFSIDGMSTMEDYCLIAGKTGTRVICFILHCAQCENTLAVHAGKRRDRRLCAGGEEQLVIGFRIEFPTVQCTDGDGFLCGIDCSYFLPYPYINAKAVPEALRSLQR